MANPNANKQVGDPCARCKTPLVAGRNGAYCKPCYIDYKNKQGGQSGGSKPSNNGKSKADIKSIILSYAKDIRVAMIISGKECDYGKMIYEADQMIKWYKGEKAEPVNNEPESLQFEDSQ